MTFETKHLIIRKHEYKDFDRFWEMMTDPIAKKYTGGITRLGYDQRLQLFKEDCAMAFSDEWAEFAIADKENDQYMGYCGFRWSEELDENELFYGFCQDSWGCGYGYEAAEAVLRYLFSNFKHNKYAATTYAENAASARILCKLGFRITKQLIIDNNMADYYIINRENYISIN